MHDIGNATDATGGWQGKKCAIDILTQVGEATPLPLVVIEDVLTILEKLRFDKVPAVRDCVKDSLRYTIVHYVLRRKVNVNARQK